jgi:hypothetical protein
MVREFKCGVVKCIRGERQSIARKGPTSLDVRTHRQTSLTWLDPAGKDEVGMLGLGKGDKCKTLLNVGDYLVARCCSICPLVFQRDTTMVD